MPWSTRKATWWTSSIWVAPLPAKNTAAVPQNRHERRTVRSVQWGRVEATARPGAAGAGTAAPAERTHSSVAGTTHTATSTARQRRADRQPSHSMRSWAKGTSAKIPTPMPAEAMPMAVPTEVGYQPRISTTEGTQPAALMPSAASTPMVR